MGGSEAEKRLPAGGSTAPAASEMQPHGNTPLRAAMRGFATERVQSSVVKIKKCRYLEATGCVAICTNLCKSATQDFFKQEAGALSQVESKALPCLRCEIFSAQ